MRMSSDFPNYWWFIVHVAKVIKNEKNPKKSYGGCCIYIGKIKYKT